MSRIIANEAQREENVNMDSFVVIIYGTPDGFDFQVIPELLNSTNAPSLNNKPKLVYVIGKIYIVSLFLIVNTLFAL